MQTASSRPATASGRNEHERNAAEMALAAQSGENLFAIVGALQRNMFELRKAHVYDAKLCHHPAIVALVAKLIYMCDVTIEREDTAFAALDALLAGQDICYDVN